MDYETLKNMQNIINEIENKKPAINHIKMDNSVYFEMKYNRNIDLLTPNTKEHIISLNPLPFMGIRVEIDNDINGWAAFDKNGKLIPAPPTNKEI